LRAVQAQDENLPTVLYGHSMVVGVNINSGDRHLPADMVIPTGVLADAVHQEQHRPCRLCRVPAHRANRDSAAGQLEAVGSLADRHVN